MWIELDPDQFDDKPAEQNQYALSRVDVFQTVDPRDVNRCIAGHICTWIVEDVECRTHVFSSVSLYGRYQ